MTIARPLNVRVGYTLWRITGVSKGLDRCAANAAPYTLALHIRAFEPLGACTRLVWDTLTAAECFAIALHNDFTLTTLLPPRLATFLVARDAYFQAHFIDWTTIETEQAVAVSIAFLGTYGLKDKF